MGAHPTCDVFVGNLVPSGTTTMPEGGDGGRGGEGKASGGSATGASVFPPLVAGTGLVSLPVDILPPLPSSGIVVPPPESGVPAWGLSGCPSAGGLTTGGEGEGLGETGSG